MAWATDADVEQITGREASPESLAVAQVIVELFSGATELASDEELIASRNLRNLTRAVAFQAVWLDSHPDALDAMGVEGVSQDGLNATWAYAHANILAPLAKLHIDRLSWKRAIRVGRGHWSTRRAALVRGNRDSAVRDDQYEWSPMPFGSTPPRSTAPGH